MKDNINLDHSTQTLENIDSSLNNQNHHLNDINNFLYSGIDSLNPDDTNQTKIFSHYFNEDVLIKNEKTINSKYAKPKNKLMGYIGLNKFHLRASIFKFLELKDILKLRLADKKFNDKLFSKKAFLDSPTKQIEFYKEITQYEPADNNSAFRIINALTKGQYTKEHLKLYVESLDDDYSFALKSQSYTLCKFYFLFSNKSYLKSPQSISN